jgi:hypothetical protein
MCIDASCTDFGMMQKCCCGMLLMETRITATSSAPMPTRKSFNTTNAHLIAEIAEKKRLPSHSPKTDQYN